MERVMKLMNKYQPRNFQMLTHQSANNELLMNMTRGDNPPHILIHGSSGSGRYTRVLLFLREIYGNDVLNISEERYKVELDNGNEIEITVRSSLHHVEFNPSVFGLRDRLVLQWLIDQTKVGPLKKTLVIPQADKLTRDAQFAIRRAMETGSWRYIFITENVSSVMRPLRSRFLDIRVESPTQPELIALLKYIRATENFEVSDSRIESIVNANVGNFRTSLMSFFVYTVANYETKPVWKTTCEEIIRTIVLSQSVDLISNFIRPKLSQLIDLGIHPSLVLQHLFRLCMSSNIDDLYKLGVIGIISKFDKTLTLGRNPWIHVENCITALMTLFSALKQ
ncbi:replication factor C subunit, putative [Entamoeba invadens IP1]|uniref:Replication factor C subunit, putative n=1 Tax=Entamoeba invadens IP1 TaxID=370355 RepID=A0A0A1TW25_ENTIV|nr:replication factor C subunit, putative [Entamoeba invadens IP1]ELP84671.1 replication factor C subunit, putative [Entamoeba invadens IP1]|eukprot:XP_004184017.1 replication factor C subunit, putative [Entamoeba invadens IP1]